MTRLTGALGEQQQKLEPCTLKASYVRVSRDLTSGDVSRIKFLLADALHADQLERAESAVDLFSNVRNTSLLTLDFLALLLSLLGRRDLLEELLPGSVVATTPPLQPLPPISSRRLHLYLELEKRNLKQQDMADVAFVNELRDPSVANREWPSLVNELLRKFPLGKQADRKMVADWVRKHIDVTGEKAQVPSDWNLNENLIRSTSVVDEQQMQTSKSIGDDQVDRVKETREVGWYGIQAIDVKFMTECYDKTNSVGSGRSADVYKGFCRQFRSLRKYEGLEVAVKVLTTPSTDRGNQFHKYFCRELLSAHVLRSPFLLPLICYSCQPKENSITGPPYYALMFPLMSGGDLRSCLFDKGDAWAVEQLPWKARVCIAHQVAVALQTLHTNIPGRRQAIVHRDVKSANILLDAFGNARLADTGLSQELGEGKSAISRTTSPGTGGYCHPAASEGPYYVHYDWFSFGVVLLELLLQKPAAARKDQYTIFLYTLLYRKKLLQYEDHCELGVSKLQDAVEAEYHDLWKDDDASLEAANLLFHIAVNCISAERGQKSFSCDDCHCKKWLGFVDGDCYSDDRSSVPTEELRPVMLLQDLCSSNRIPLFNQEKPAEVKAAAAAPPPEAALRRCASCFVTLASEVAGLHTLSSLCQPEQCSWYCSTCLRSGEPVYCLQHGRAQPIIGGDNAYFIAVSGCGKGADVFEQDCKRLLDTLTDARFAGIRHNNARVIIAPSGDEVRHALLSLKLQLEERVVRAAVSRASRDLCPGLKYPKMLEEAVCNVGALVQKTAAVTKARCSKGTEVQRYEVQRATTLATNEEKMKRLLATLVDIAWKRTEHVSAGEEAEGKAEQLLAMTDLWSFASKATPGEPGYEGKLGKSELLRERARQAEQPKLARLARQPKDRLDDAKQAIRRLADECFAALISSSCVPTSALELLLEKGSDVQQAVACLTSCLGESAMAEADRSIAESLRPLADGFVWYHYCGHSTAAAGLPDAALSHELLEAAGRHVANLVVTLDCCHAHASAPKLRFHVDERAPYSGYVVVSSCTAAQESQFGLSTAFTEFLVGGLRSAIDDCRQAFDRAFRGRACDKSDCQPCQTYNTGMAGAAAAGIEYQCEACKSLRRHSDGCLQLADIFKYVKAHLCIDRMRPVLDSSYAERHLPVAYFLSKRPTYDVLVRLPPQEPLTDAVELVVCLKDVPATVEQLKIAVLAEILQFMQDQKVPLDVKLTPALACKLAGCSRQESRSGAVAAAELSPTARRDCTASALRRLLDKFQDRLSIEASRSSNDTRADQFDLHTSPSGGSDPVHVGGAVQCEDIDEPAGHPPANAGADDAYSLARSTVALTEKVVPAGVLAHLTLRTAVCEITDDAVMKTMFRKGFAIYCSVSL